MPRNPVCNARSPCLATTHRQKMYYPKSKSLRLPGYDYSQPGWYFVTLTTRNRSCLSGSMQDGEIVISEAGHMIETTWKELASNFVQIELDVYQVMPDHFHGILIIKPISVKTERAEIYASPKPLNTQQSISLIELMEKFKSLTTNRYINGVKRHGWQQFSRKLWESSFHDHVIRNDGALRSVREYISNNVRKWELESKRIVP